MVGELLHHVGPAIGQPTQVIAAAGKPLADRRQGRPEPGRVEGLQERRRLVEHLLDLDGVLRLAAGNVIAGAQLRLAGRRWVQLHVLVAEQRFGDQHGVGVARD